MLLYLIDSKCFELPFITIADRHFSHLRNISNLSLLIRFTVTCAALRQR